MTISKAEFSTYIKSFQFRKLFNEMGWNNDHTKQLIILDEIPYNLTAIAEKSGFRIFVCEPPSGNKIPDSATRKKIEGKVTKLFQEHLIVFIDEHKREQLWQLAVRKAGSPTKISETRYSILQDPELLYQRAGGLFFTLDEEEKVTIIDVTKRVADNFQQNNERVTKRFYESFKKEHSIFLKFIEGIDDQLNLDWYASLMLNRLMFCYFIQKKGFLDNNKNYLQDKLKACKEKRGKNKFYSFYCDFLLALFHKGLGAPEHSKNLEVEIGKIPYLNGGLFDEHEIEKTYKQIAIDDKAFEKLFDFFDQYEWHLDTRESASGRDINPDVIGYIFEKFINDRAQMGAYYTKEDITDYIAKNCIIPWLFDALKPQYSKTFADDGWLWQMVKASGTDYIYDAVKYSVPENGGLFDDLPAEIQKGFALELEKKVVDGNAPWLWELRKEWNKPAPSDVALPTEIYREVIERRIRYVDIKTKIENGEIIEIDDFITYNLNIRQFAQDVVETTNDAEFIRHFYKTLSRITILDPTCGSGAFLFAAMNILEPLYDACIHRMKNFIYESGKGKHKFFEETIAQVNAPEHPNLQYFIFKSIILNNLYGVDIMNEAVEIAKLRLFLKLVATVDANYCKPNLGLEPLPDIDFNIRAGNTLVGFASEEHLLEAVRWDIDGQYRIGYEAILEKFKEESEVVGMAFKRFKEVQLVEDPDSENFKQTKNELCKRLAELNAQLNEYLAGTYGVVTSNAKQYQKWLASHKPFHWLAEFYEIVHGNGGFDVIIGNPPYVNYNIVKRKYSVKKFSTVPCNDLFALVFEQTFKIVTDEGRLGLIIRLSPMSNPSMKTLRELITKQNRSIYISSYSASAQPACLFEGVRDRLSIYILKEIEAKPSIFTSNFLKWFSEERSHLFQSILQYHQVNRTNGLKYIPKIGLKKAFLIYEKVIQFKKLPYFLAKTGKYTLYYHESPVHWHKAWPYIPYYFLEKVGEKKSVSIRELNFNNKDYYNAMKCIANSSLLYWFYNTTSDCRHLTLDAYCRLPTALDSISTDDFLKFNNNAKLLFESYERYKKRYSRESKKTGRSEFDAYYPAKSKSIIDDIDTVLAKHFNFTEEELDFIINYDIKYRMGKELNSSEVGE